jgi:hypothetical protein
MGEKGGGNDKSREPRIDMRHWASPDRRAVLPLKPDRLADAECIVSPGRPAKRSLTGFDTDLITFPRVSKSNRLAGPALWSFGNRRRRQAFMRRDTTTAIWL